MKFNVINTKEDIFDRVERELKKVEILKPRAPDIFDRTELDTEDKILYSKEIAEMIQERIREAITKIPKPVIPEPKPQIIKEVRVEVVKERTDTSKYVEIDTVENLKKQIEELKEALEESRRIMQSVVLHPGGSGVVGIPPPETGAENYVLTISNRKAIWKASGAGAIGTSPDAYTPTNVTTDLSFDADSTSVDELADVLGSLIASLQGAGIIQ